MNTTLRYFLKDIGAKILHLGGGLGGADDSLYRFKLGFGTDVHPFYTLRVVHDRATYDELNRSVVSGEHEESDDAFFPPYRRPSSSIQ